jgi:hypothetical protein
MPFLPPVIVDGHVYCREHNRPACTPHEFRILVGFSHEIRNQFFEHMNAGKLPVIFNATWREIFTAMWRQ